MAAPLPVICLAGPTGCGKTAAALALAEALDGEVINADSRQVYSDFPLITAQPSPAERACCPHHLYGFLPTERKISAGRWAGQAVAAARAVLARGHVPLLVGGTGLYFQALLHGIAEIPAVDPAVTAALTARLARRIDLMLEQGALDEARAARQRCDDAAAPGWSGIGCAEVLAHLRWDLSLAECRRLWLHNTRAYAKRQRTWFRARSGARFFAPQDLDGLLAAARQAC